MEKLLWTPNTLTDDLFSQFTISFPNGSIKSTKDVLLSMFKEPSALDTCSPESVRVQRRQHARTLYPNGPTTQVKEANFDKFNYSNGGTSKAAGGERILILINGSKWTARLTGSHQAFMAYLCDNRDALAPGFSTWYSNKGKPYTVSSSTSND